MQEPGLIRQVVLSNAPERPPLPRPPYPNRVPRPAPVPQEDSVLLDAMAFLHRNYGVILTAAILCAGIGLAVAMSQSPDYRATATIEIQDLNENFLNLQEISPVASINDSSMSTDVQTQLRILRSNALLERTLSRLGTEQIPPPKGLLAVWRQLRDAPEKTPNQEDLLERAAANLKLQETRQARIVDLTYDSPDPEYAAKFVNTLAQQYMDQSIESRLQISEGTSAFLTRQLQELRDKLAQSQMRLQDYAQRSGLVINGQDRAPAAEKLRQVQLNLSNAEENRMVKQARLETVAAAPAESIAATESSSKRDYKTQLTELRRQRADLLAVYQPSFAGVERVEAQIASLETELRAESMALLQDARNDFADAVRRETLLRDSFVEQTHLVSEEAENSIQYGMLKNEVDSNQHLYEMILQRTAEAKVAAAMRASNTRLVDAAKTPRLPYRPSRSLNLMWGGTAGLLLGLVVANARERYDRRIKKPGDLGFHLNIPELGSLPSAGAHPSNHFQLGSADGGALNARQQSKSDKLSLAVAESCRGILTSILFSDEVARVPQIIVITSAERGEGKTTLAANLAESLARMNRRVLLIDGDLRQPQLHKIFNVPNNYGLGDLLTLQTDNCDLIGYVAQPTRIPGVHLLAAGPHDARALDMLYSAGTLNLLSNARQEFDTILIDTPPMIDLPDARILGRMADGVVLVARAGVTTRDVALAAKVRLDEDRTALLGTVLNNWTN
ncbi:MAG: polysaccharide biosynthesis tyrosine autokinase [Acidobacteriota bacterium]